MKIAVLGLGAWGTALARLLHQGGHTVTAWGHQADHLNEIRATGKNEHFLPGIDFPRDIVLESVAARAVVDAELTLVAVPSKAFNPDCQVANPSRALIILAVALTACLGSSSARNCCAR